MNHRNFLLAVSTVLTGSGALQGSVAHAAAPDGRPNFLFIFTDDQRWDAMGCVQREQGEKGRFPWIQTPHMDRIAAEGLRFRQAFVVNSLCSPSKGYADDVTTDYAIGFIKQTKDKPFSMVVGFKAPHNDRTPPDRRKNDYSDVSIRPAVSAGVKVPYMQSTPGKETDPTTPDRRNYMRCITGADDNVGRLLSD